MTDQNEYRSVRLTGGWPSDISGEIQDYFGADISVHSTEASFPSAMLPWAELGTLISATAAAITLGLNFWDRLKSRRTVSSTCKPESQLPLSQTELVELKNVINGRGIFGVRVQRIIVTEDGSVLASIYNEIAADSLMFRLSGDSTGLTVAIEKDR